MRSTGFLLSSLVLGSLYLIEYHVAAQNPPAPQTQPGQAAPAGDVRGVAGVIPGSHREYPKRPQAPQAVIDRGKSTFGVSCAFCHGSDARGGEIGPNLLRSAVVLEDQNGELIAPIVHGGRVQQGMPRIDLNDTQISDVAAWLHNFNPVGKGAIAYEDINIVTGDPKAGEVYFKKTCSSCHSLTSSEIAGIGTRIPVAKTLQQTWLLPGGGGERGSAAYSSSSLGLHVPPATVTVTTPDGKTVTGDLVSVSDFYVGLTGADSRLEGFRRDGDVSKVELHDPLAAHRDLIQKYTDKDIHDVTAYLVTLK